MPQTLTFPQDHPHYPGYQLTIPDDATQDELDKIMEAADRGGLDTGAPSVKEDISKATAVAPAKAAIGMAGAVGDISDIPNRFGNWSQQKLQDWGLLNPEEKQKQEQRFNQKYGQGGENPFTSSAIRKDVEGVTGPLYEPQTLPGKMVGGAVEMGTGALLGGAPAAESALARGAGLGARALDYAKRKTAPALIYGAAPGAASEAVGAQTEGYKFPGWIPGVGGQDISPYAKVVTSLFGGVPLRKAITPNTADPHRLQQYNKVVKESQGEFKPTAGQLFDNPRMRNEELYARQNAGGDLNREQNDAFMKTVTAPTGNPTAHVDSRDPDSWMAKTMADREGELNNLERTTHIQGQGNRPLRNGNTALAHPEFANIAMNRPQDVNSILGTIYQTTGRSPSARALVGEELHNALFGANGRGRLSGEEYRRLRTNLNTAAEGAGSNELAHSYRQTANALDAALTRTDPRWAQQWGDARRKYANTLVFEQAAKAKPNQTQFSPDQIDRATQVVMGMRPHLKGELENSKFLNAAAAFRQGPKAWVKHTPQLPEEAGAFRRNVAQYIPGGQTLLNKGKQIGFGLGALGAGAASHFLGGDALHALGSALEGGVGGLLLGEKMGKTAPKLTPYAMNPTIQAYRKNQFSPLASQSERTKAAVIRGLFSNAVQNQNQQNAKNNQK